MTRTPEIVLADLRVVCAYADGVVAATRSTGPCDPIPEPPVEGEQTTEGEICRILARIRYLTDLLVCESQANPPECCQRAEDRYLREHNGCPL